MAISNHFPSYVNVVNNIADPTDEAIRRFCSRYRVSNISVEYDHAPVPGYASSYSYYTNGQPRISMTIKRDALVQLAQLDDEYSYLVERQREERRIRERSPAVQKAWEDYQLVLTLAQ